MHSVNDVWFVYDGACPLCTFGSAHWRIREAAGTLHILDARENANHPVMLEIKAKGIDLDKGMVVKFADTLYHGVDALHVMAMIGSTHGWYNKLNVFLFRSKHVSKCCYPFMRAARELALIAKGEKHIRNLD